jgi:hypothetical protein
MIPSTSFHDNGDGTAWLVLARRERDSLLPDLVDIWTEFDRPCDTCDGCKHICTDGVNAIPCTDCFNGRHAFTIEVECPWIDENGPDTRTFTVAVRPCHVLTIVDGMDKVLARETLTDRCIVMWSDYAELYDPDPTAQRWTRITLPPDAKPGKRAVLLDVAPENVETL